jgi:succinoglycan biosynthesis transport protein ExoP
MASLRSGDSGVAPSTDAPPLADAPETPFRLDLRRSLQLHWKLALLIFILGLAIAAAYFVVSERTYDAQSLINLEPPAAKVLDQTATSRWPDSAAYQSYVEQQILNATRNDVLASALKRMGPGVWQKQGESEQAAIDRLRLAIEVARLGTSYQFAITAHAPSAELAAKIANAVAVSYLDRASHEQKSFDAQRLSILAEERDRIRTELDTDRTEQEALNKQLGVAAVGATPDHFDEDISHLREELIKARTAHDEAEAHLTAMGASQDSSSAAMDAEADALIATDMGLGAMKTSLNQRRATLVSQMANLTPNHPQYKQDTQELAQIDSSINNMQRDLRAKAAQRLRNDLERTSGVEARLNGQLGQMAAAAGNVTFRMQRANDLAADILRLQARFAQVDGQWRNLSLDDSAPADALLSAVAVAPLRHAKSKRLANTITIALAGLLLGLLAAVGKHKLDPKLYIASDFEQVLGFPPLAVVPDFYQVSDGVAEEHLLRLSTEIEYAHQQGSLKNCIFTGVGAGAGVTTIATRVRSMLDTMGMGTVLVDASGTPSPAEPHEADHREASSSQLVALRASRSTALRQQLAEEAEAGDESLVLTDTAPLSVSAETAYLARFVDAAIVVVESGVTTRAQLRDVANTLERLDVRAVGYVLNRVGMAKADPAFRQSVQAIENHLHTQSLSIARGTERSQPEIHSTAPAELATPPADTAAAEPKAEAPIQLPAPAAEPPARSRSAVQPAPVPPAVEPEKSFEAASIPSLAHIPAVAPQTAPVEPQAITPQTLQQAPAAPQVAEQKAVPPLPTLVDQSVAKQPVAEQPDEQLPRPAVPVPPVAAAPKAATDQPVAKPVPARPRTAVSSTFVPVAPAQSPAQSWERVASQTGEFVPSRASDFQPAPIAEAPRPEPEDLAQNGATRLSGLRNLLFSLGLKNLNQAHEDKARQAESNAWQPEDAPRPAPFEMPEPPHIKEPPLASIREPRVPAPPPAYVPLSEPVAVAPNRVTATPEFLPPKPPERESSAKSAHDRHRERRDTVDDVQILPSWRGQYKFKR